MKQTLVAAFALMCISQANAQETHASFFANDPALAATAQAASASPVRMANANITRDNSFVSPAGEGINALIDTAARRHGVPVNIARAAVRVESKGRCNARGRAGELGPLQIKPATARGLGYSGPASALATCGAGLEWGMRHLALAYRKCGHVGPHNYGLGGGCMRTAYVRKVMAYS